MRAMFRLISVTVLVVGLAAGLQIAAATTITSASHYGPGINSDPTKTFANCSNPANTSPCEAFDLTSIGTVTLNGSTSKSVVRFSFNANGTEGPILDVFDLGSIGSNQTFTLSSSLFTAAQLANAQIFSCDNGTTTPTDSMDVSLTGPCTPGIPAFSLSYAALISNGVVNGLASFKTTDAFNLSDLVLEVPAPANTTPTPEPASLALLGTGLATLLAVRRRKQ